MKSLHPRATGPACLAALLFLGGAGCYTGSARDTSAERVAADPNWRFVRDVPFIAQRSDVDCGAAALAMVLTYEGLPTTEAALLGETPPKDGGITAAELRDAARRRGLEAFVISGTWNDLEDQIARGRPVVVGLLKPILGGRARAHYEVVVGINRRGHRILSLDPAAGGLRENSVEGFAREWAPGHEVTLVILPPMRTDRGLALSH
jgi:ABC-type bacteriocin/lantibiotic exporter with double-glycine peptidase domain